MKEAIFYKCFDDNIVQCFLCNFYCKIKNNNLGRCCVRKNINGKLYSMNYNSICSANIEPIEKKSLFHFQPGQNSFSISALGCNFQCNFCENWEISQSPRLKEKTNCLTKSYKPVEIINNAITNKCTSVSYTYTEPTVFMELVSECGLLAKEKGLSNILVSNGYMTIETIDYLSNFIDGINIDLKSFSNNFYKKVCKSSIQPVLKTLKHIVKNTNIWLEITTLVIPGLNDSDKELKQIAKFIYEELSPHIPWHISRFYPTFKRIENKTTPIETLSKAYNFGKSIGLYYVYNCENENTFCHKCNKLLIERSGFKIKKNNFKKNNCSFCGAKIEGKFEI